MSTKEAHLCYNDGPFSGVSPNVRVSCAANICFIWRASPQKKKTPLISTELTGRHSKQTSFADCRLSLRQKRQMFTFSRADMVHLCATMRPLMFPPLC